MSGRSAHGNRHGRVNEQMPRPRVVPRMRSRVLGALKEAGETMGAEELALELLGEARRKQRSAPEDPQALEELIRCQLRLSGVRDDVTEDGFGPKARADRRYAAQAWQRLLALDPPAPDPALAFRMANVFSKEGLDDPGAERRALEIGLEHTESPTAGRYERLARLYHREGRFRDSAVAAERAVELMPRLLRGWMRRQMRDLAAPGE
jgi:tetratricopeptide (TPR) repeat protein